MMKTLFYTYIFIYCFTGTAQFLLPDFDVNTTDIATIRYTKFERKLANDAGTYYKPHEIVFPNTPKKEVVSFDANGYLTLRSSTFTNNVYTYNKNYTQITTIDTKAKKTFINTLVPIQRRFVFVKTEEMGAIARDASNRVIEISNTKFPSQKISVTYQQDSYTIKEPYSNRTYLNNGKEVINSFSGADYKYYNANNAIEFNIRVNYTYVSGYDFYLYEYDAKGNWITKAKFHYTTGFDNKEWHLEQIIYRELEYRNGAKSTPTIKIEEDRKKYMSLATTFPAVDYNPKKNGYAAYIGKTDLLNLKQTNTNKGTPKKKNSEVVGCIEGDCKDGLGKKQLDNSTLTAIFSKSRINSIGFQEYSAGVYSGEFINGKREGYGTYNWTKNKQTYIGTWKNGNQDGYGIVLEGDKVIQAGTYEAGKQKTTLLEEYNSGKVNGNCTGDCTNGFGKITFENGDWYLGFFNQSKFFKLGIYFFKSDQSTYWGTYENHKMHGAGHYITSEYTYVGNLKDGRLSGKGIKEYTAGGTEAGRFENGSLVISYGKLK